MFSSSVDARRASSSHLPRTLLNVHKVTPPPSMRKRAVDWLMPSTFDARDLPTARSVSRSALVRQPFGVGLRILLASVSSILSFPRRLGASLSLGKRILPRPPRKSILPVKILQFGRAMSRKYHSSLPNEFQTRYFSSARSVVDSSRGFSKTPYHALARKKKVSRIAINYLELATTRVRTHDASDALRDAGDALLICHFVLSPQIHVENKGKRQKIRASDRKNFS